MKKNKIIRRIIASVILIVLLCMMTRLFHFSHCYYSGHTLDEYKQEALEKGIKISTDSDLVIHIEGNQKSDIAVIFYPGGQVEYTAYLPILTGLAQQGVDSFLINMPLNYAFLGINSADGVIKKYGSQYDEWYMAGHSLGGAMAASYVSKHLDYYDGIIFLAAYSTKSLNSDGFKVLSLYGSEDYVLNAQRRVEARSLMPETYTELMIDGGNHAQFGDYGEQKGDGTAKITKEEQWAYSVEQIMYMISPRQHR